MQWLIEKVDSFQKMTIEELEEERLQIETDLAAIKDRIDDSYARFKLTHTTDHEWLKRARSAKRAKGLLHQEVLRELARRRKKQKSENRETGRQEDLDSSLRFERCFFNAAKSVLPEQVLDRLIALAMEDCKVANFERGQTK